MFSRGVGIIGLVLLLALSAGAGLATQTDWNVVLSAYVGSIGGAPQDVGNYFGVDPLATDGWDLGIDMKKPPMPPGDYVWLWFNRPTWGVGDIAGDFRSEIDEGASKVWGTGFTDTLNIKAKLLSQPGSGVVDHCGWMIEYPVASAIYVVWEIGVGVDKAPPEDYIITLQYKGGINAKPEGTAPPGVTVPVPDETWDMRAVSDIVIPLWYDTFEPPNAECTATAVPDTAKFKITVENPGVPMSCDITFSPDNPAVDEAVSFNGNATGGTSPYTYDWDFGDAGSSTDAAPSHTYTAGGAFTVSLTVTDNTLATTSCDTTVNVNWPPTCSITADPAEPNTLDTVQFESGASDSDGTVVSYAWDFGDASTSTDASPTHQFDNGTFNVTLTVTDNQGATGSCSLQLVVANVDPTCYITYDPLAPTVDDLISFDSHATDPDGTVVSVTWEFGDTNSGSGVTTDHQYSTADTYTVDVTVVDNDGGTGICSEDVVVGPTVTDDTPPTLTITTPAAGATVSGDLSAGWLSADAADPDTGISKVEFFLDGKLLGTGTVGPTSYQAPGINSTLYGNGTHYVGAKATNGDSLTTEMSWAVAFSNPVDPANFPVIYQSVVRTELIIGPPRQIRVELTVGNAGFSADDVTIENFLFVGSYRDLDTGELILVNILAHPTSGGDWPRNLGTIGAGEAQVLEVLSDPLPAQVTHVRRWMDYGTYTKTGVPGTVYTL